MHIDADIGYITLLSDFCNTMGSGGQKNGYIHSGLLIIKHKYKSHQWFVGKRTILAARNIDFQSTGKDQQNMIQDKRSHAH